MPKKSNRRFTEAAQRGVIRLAGSRIPNGKSKGKSKGKKRTKNGRAVTGIFVINGEEEMARRSNAGEAKSPSKLLERAVAEASKDRPANLGAHGMKARAIYARWLDAGRGQGKYKAKKWDTPGLRKVISKVRSMDGTMEAYEGTVSRSKARSQKKTRRTNGKETTVKGTKSSKKKGSKRTPNKGEAQSPSSLFQWALTRGKAKAKGNLNRGASEARKAYERALAAGRTVNKYRAASWNTKPFAKFRDALRDSDWYERQKKRRSKSSSSGKSGGKKKTTTKKKASKSKPKSKARKSSSSSKSRSKSIRGSGKDGRILKTDIVRAIESGLVTDSTLKAACGVDTLPGYVAKAKSKSKSSKKKTTSKKGSKKKASVIVTESGFEIPARLDSLYDAYRKLSTTKLADIVMSGKKDEKTVAHAVLLEKGQRYMQRKQNGKKAATKRKNNPSLPAIDSKNVWGTIALHAGGGTAIYLGQGLLGIGLEKVGLSKKVAKMFKTDPGFKKTQVVYDLGTLGIFGIAKLIAHFGFKRKQGLFGSFDWTVIGVLLARTLADSFNAFIPGTKKGLRSALGVGALGSYDGSWSGVDGTVEGSYGQLANYGPRAGYEANTGMRYYNFQPQQGMGGAPRAGYEANVGARAGYESNVGMRYYNFQPQEGMGMRYYNFQPQQNLSGPPRAGYEANVGAPRAGYEASTGMRYYNFQPQQNLSGPPAGGYETDDRRTSNPYGPPMF